MGFGFVSTVFESGQQGTSVSLHYGEEKLHLEDWAAVPELWLRDAVPRMTAEERSLMLRHKIVAYCWLPDCTVYGVVDEGGLREGRRLGLTLVGRVPIGLYRKIVRRNFAPVLLRNAVYGLARDKPWASASTRLSGPQCATLGLILTFFAAALVLHFAGQLLLGFEVLACLFFLMVVGLRCLCLFPLPKARRTKALRLSDDEHPTYTVLVPLFRETRVLKQIVRSLDALDYPREKLDIKIILEENDHPMHAAVKSSGLPWYFDIIIVPAGQPQTKPRALNYAMQFSRGTLVTIYDGEDIPQPNQLRLAVAAFSYHDQDMACLQAALDFFNPSENWLARHFTAEYAALFRVVLPALASYGLPLPLGGTSNHFRASALAAVGYWDAFNVTEDADLGMRLARHGYKAGVLHSTTFEEANTHLGNWMKQRRRWLKGFLQTWLVHMRNPLHLARETGWGGFMAVQAMTVGVFASSLLHPLLLVAALLNFLPAKLTVQTSTFSGAAVSGLSLVILLAGYVSAIATCEKGLHRIGIFGWSRVLCTIPLYWLLMSAAAWMALWDFVVAPFHWHKTNHGLSRMTGETDQ
jgi:glycosyltransferase XagB